VWRPRDDGPSPRHTDVRVDSRGTPTSRRQRRSFEKTAIRKSGRWHGPCNSSGTTTNGQGNHTLMKVPKKCARTRKLPPWVGSRTPIGGILALQRGEDVKRSRPRSSSISTGLPRANAASTRSRRRSNCCLLMATGLTWRPTWGRGSTSAMNRRIVSSPRTERLRVNTIKC